MLILLDLKLKLILERIKHNSAEFKFPLGI